MHFTYIIQSRKHGRYYIGSTSDLHDRLHRHNTGRNISTRNGIPWIMVYFETHATMTLAIKREYEIKRFKGGNAFRRLLIWKGG